MKRIMTGGWMAAAVCLSMHAEYSLEIDRGEYPEGVLIENLNGNMPDQTWYKNGWTTQGWTIDNYGERYGIALSPSHVAAGRVCENAMMLPAIKIEDGEWLMWEGCEVYPLFSDTYTVEIRPSGDTEWATLGEFTESKSTWRLHMLDLKGYHGTEAQVRFVCRSTAGYMLALDGIRIKKPSEHTFSLINHTPKFFGIGELEDGAVMTEISITNTGLPVEGATLGIKTEGNTLSTLTHEAVWATGETHTFTLPLPLDRNVKTEYQITIESPDMEAQAIGESFAYCTSFKRHLYVDKGTGMWCNFCPNGTLAVDELKETYGDALIVGETHNSISRDPLSNDIDFAWLKFYSIPQLMLNRIPTTKGDGYGRFESELFLPTEMEVNITGMRINSDGTLTAEATVSTSGEFSAADRSFRIGYVLTRNVAGTEDPRYYQKNICTTSTQKQYRYLPSNMIYTMCGFHDVTLPSPLATASENPAFSGVPGSLPESLAAGETYGCEWDVPLPQGYDSFDGIRLVAYILDAGNRTIINSTAAEIDRYAGVEKTVEDLPAVDQERIFTIDGRQVAGAKERLQPGLYIVNGKKVLVR